MNGYLYDPHTHTAETSKCGHLPAAEVVDRYVRQGYAVCTDFYSPDYSQRPLPDVKDHRRTLLWLPRLTFDANGQATVRLYNNSKTSVLSVEAEGITTDGRPVVWKTDNLSFRP